MDVFVKNNAELVQGDVIPATPRLEVKGLDIPTLLHCTRVCFMLICQHQSYHINKEEIKGAYRLRQKQRACVVCFEVPIQREEVAAGEVTKLRVLQEGYAA